MSKPSVSEVAVAFAGAAGHHDLSALAQWIADDFIFRVPGKNPLSGERRGLQGLLEFLDATQKLTTGHIKTEVLDLLIGQDYAALYTRTQAQRPDRPALDNPSLMLLKISDGKVHEAWSHNRDQAAVDAFWS